MTETMTATNNHSFSRGAGAMSLVTQAFHDGATDAREAAARTWAASSRFASRFVYTTCYTISYGVVFPSMLLAKAVPKDNIAIRGLMDGAQAAGEKVDQLLSRRSDAPVEGHVAASATA